VKPKTHMTTNYNIFTYSVNNRPLEPEKHRALRASMEKHGFLPEFPIVIIKDNGAHVVDDGQHRLYFAMEMGLPIYWTEKSGDWSVSEIGKTLCRWTLKDHVNTFANRASGEHYQILRAFVDEHGILVGSAAAVLAGRLTLNQMYEDFYTGAFKVAHLEAATRAAKLYRHAVGINAAVKKARLFEAFFIAIRVDGFNDKIMMRQLDRASDMVIPCTSRKNFLKMIEGVYNYGRKDKLAIEVPAAMIVQSMQGGGQS